MSRRWQLIIGASLTAAVAAVFYYSFGTPVQRSYRALEIKEEAGTAENSLPYAHPLTGIPRAEPADFFAVHVLYDNFFGVKRHAGLDKAAIVYEAMAEGDISRWMAIFDSTESVPNVGPVRSVRPYFVDWAEEYGGVMLHVGGSPQGLTRVRKSPVINLDQIGAHETYFRRDKTAPAPHNVFSSHSSWLEAAERYTVPAAEFRPWSFDAPAPSGGSRGHQVDISFAASNKVSWVYNAETNSYLRFINGSRQYHATGAQIAAANVIVLVVEARVIDGIGRLQMSTTGTGDATVYTGGRRGEGRWLKPGVAERMKLLDDGGQDMSLTPGVTWVEVVPSRSAVTYQIL